MKTEWYTLSGVNVIRRGLHIYAAVRGEYIQVCQIQKYTEVQLHRMALAAARRHLAQKLRDVDKALKDLEHKGDRRVK